MGSLTPPKIPIMDFSNEDLKPGSSSWISTRVQVRKALEELGCFEVIYDKVPMEAHQEMFGAMKDLFKLPVETKIKSVNEVLNYGYIGQDKNIPHHEGIGIGDAAAIENVQSFTNLMWPEGNPSFCQTVHSYVHRVLNLEQMVKRMVFESFGLEKYVDSSIESTDYLLRLMVYTPQGSETRGLPAHTDKCFVTVLHQNQINGLQVLTKEGEWFPLAPSSPKSFIVMIGESFVAWSNGRLHCPRHHVVMNGLDTRYAIAMFSFNKGIVETPEELVDEEHPLLYKPFHHLDLFRFYFSSEKARTERYTIQEYCAV
ncbi:hypothetical protein IFM89_004789 [Coptis chinensis]|uniref:Fe2OG dioxygenase domain-containing protein n=1 Tax=Coptis chinensis TaxID=261450 RepID=A0A835LZ70_9MAGN|nr:hypothetical protein IFM89_004789 [Coptis chinensis]